MMWKTFIYLLLRQHEDLSPVARLKDFTYYSGDGLRSLCIHNGIVVSIHVNTVVGVEVENLQPVVVGLSLVRYSLVHIFLHLLQFVGIHTLGHTIDFLVHDVEHLSCHLWLERTVSQNSCHILEIILRSSSY